MHTTPTQASSKMKTGKSANRCHQLWWRVPFLNELSRCPACFCLPSTGLKDPWPRSPTPRNFYPFSPHRELSKCSTTELHSQLERHPFILNNQGCVCIGHITYSQRSSCLCFLSAGITGVGHHTQLRGQLLRIGSLLPSCRSLAVEFRLSG